MSARAIESALNHLYCLSYVESNVLEQRALLEFVDKARVELAALERDGKALEAGDNLADAVMLSRISRLPGDNEACERKAVAYRAARGVKP